MHFKMIDQIRMVQKHGICLSHELTERDIEKRKTICELLLQRLKRKKFLHRIVTGDEKWTIRNDQKHGYVHVT